MNITWLGHACFLLEQEGYRIVTDPYEEVEGYPELRTSAHAVYCSHQHFDHNATGRVDLLPERESPFAVREIPAFHDNENGALRGPSTIRVFTAGGLSVAHLGDLGHQLSEEQLAALDHPDVLLIPVGGFYTVDGAGAKRICESVRPRCVVPMHYRFGSYGFANIGTADTFLSLWKPEEIHYLDSPSWEPDGTAAGVYVPAFP